MAQLSKQPELLQEFSDSRGVEMKVDREEGVLRGVKLLGLQSSNGRRYQESALAAATALYEESKVNVNHSKAGPLSPRDYQDRLGVIRNVKLRDGAGLFGDLHFNPKHALAEQLAWDAEHNPRNVGFSHNVLARLSREGEQAVVEEITDVQSVDLVADPATTQGLFEHDASEPGALGKDERRWDALTLEVLQLHRPDLLEEMQAFDANELRKQLAEADQQTALLKRRQRILELLCEHQLKVANEQATPEQSSPQTVSPQFVELLMHVTEEQDLEALIAERAELARRAARAEFLSPLSRDQALLSSDRLPSVDSAAAFAATLKATRN